MLSGAGAGGGAGHVSPQRCRYACRAVPALHPLPTALPYLHATPEVQALPPPQHPPPCPLSHLLLFPRPGVPERPARPRWFLDAVRRARDLHDFHLWAWVIMPEHVHLLLWPQRDPYDMSDILYSIKKPVTNAALKHVRLQRPPSRSVCWTASPMAQPATASGSAAAASTATSSPPAKSGRKSITSTGTPCAAAWSSARRLALVQRAGLSGPARPAITALGSPQHAADAGVVVMSRRSGRTGGHAERGPRPLSMPPARGRCKMSRRADRSRLRTHVEHAERGPRPLSMPPARGRCNVPSRGSQSAADTR